MHLPLPQVRQAGGEVSLLLPCNRSLQFVRVLSGGFQAMTLQMRPTAADDTFVCFITAASNKPSVRCERSSKPLNSMYHKLVTAWPEATCPFVQLLDSAKLHAALKLSTAHVAETCTTIHGQMLDVRISNIFASFLTRGLLPRRCTPRASSGRGFRRLKYRAMDFRRVVSAAILSLCPRNGKIRHHATLLCCNHPDLAGCVCFRVRIAQRMALRTEVPPAGHDGPSVADARHKAAPVPDCVAAGRRRCFFGVAKHRGPSGRLPGGVARRLRSGGETSAILAAGLQCKQQACFFGR